MDLLAIILAGLLGFVIGVLVAMSKMKKVMKNYIITRRPEETVVQSDMTKEEIDAVTRQLRNAKIGR